VTKRLLSPESPFAAVRKVNNDEAIELLGRMIDPKSVQS
jgi:hypothetical protein